MSMLSKKDRKFYSIVLVSIIIMIGFRYLPTFGQITPDGMKILGIFLGCIFGWVCGELVWTSLLGLVILSLSNFGTMTDNFASAFANSTIQIMISSMVFCYSIEKSGLLSEVSKWIVGQKWAQKSPWLIVFVFFLGAAVIAIMTANFIVATVIMWMLFYELANEINVKPHDPYAVIILSGCGVAACMGNATMPYQGMPSLVNGMAQAIFPDFLYNTGQFILMTYFLTAVYLALVIVVLRFLFGTKVKSIVIPKKDAYKMQLNTQSKVTLLFLILLVVILIVPNFLPSENPIRLICNSQLTIAGSFILFSIILMIIRVNEEPILDISVALSKIQWPMIILVGTALCISDYLTADGMGVVPTIVSVLNPLIEGKSAFMVTLMFIAFGLIITNFINDMVTIMVLFPIAAQFITDAGGSIMLLAILFGQACVQGCLMPSGSAVGAMLHANPEWMSSKDVFKYVAIMETVVLSCLIFIALLGGVVGI